MSAPPSSIMYVCIRSYLPTLIPIVDNSIIYNDNASTPTHLSFHRERFALSFTSHCPKGQQLLKNQSIPTSNRPVPSPTFSIYLVHSLNFQSQPVPQGPWVARCAKYSRRCIRNIKQETTFLYPRPCPILTSPYLLK